ncbi:Arf family GTPase CIN4 NDAI_0H02920 [Naumovozyma dairenensis CBS 421]|uniref:ADP-ribosylation factor-like protein 2 n=1 Tax=Naumovozyma dairenensis (strain ATCC 10597 / BCRC 20456 / CBS 421 / NBRC 0211 / NRRL Y-12639) TaxID=1071378 RepID=G0WFA4_NAUDC|nr:hypothetical protein NDAI_0H02920 [Naumovozyma dairenensis CBS 421]CCD26465.1 hypothetical protein NDAI_0H02920 [Naumovozyma dairenensis CBS 421]
MGLLTIIKKQKQKDKEVKCLLLGLDNSGKSTLVNRLQISCSNEKQPSLEVDKMTEITPTIGFRIISFPIKDNLISIWDIGGQTSLRPFWNNYFDKTNILIWCIDISDLNRLHESINELRKLLITKSCDVEGEQGEGEGDGDGDGDAEAEAGKDVIAVDCKIIIVLNKVDLISRGDCGATTGQEDIENQVRLRVVSGLSLSLADDDGDGSPRVSFVTCSALTGVGLRPLAEELSSPDSL